MYFLIFILCFPQGLIICFSFFEEVECVKLLNLCTFYREETEIIEGEVVEIQIDRPATGTVRKERNR